MLISCSAAIITAYLMRSEQRFQEDALESLRQCCEFVCPNDGFLKQLKLFEEMSFKVDTISPLYKRICLKVLDRYSDPELRQLHNLATGISSNFATAKVIVEHITKLVWTQMGGAVMDEEHGLLS